MRAFGTILIAVVALVVGFFVGRTTAKAAPVPSAPKQPVIRPPAKPAPMAPPTVGGFQFEGMEFDLSPEFQHPAVNFLEPGKIYFRLRLKDMRVPAAGGKKPKANLAYRRVGDTPGSNGPMRLLTDADLKPTGQGNEVVAYKPGLTFMANPKEGKTSFEILADGQPLGRAAFTVGQPTPVPGMGQKVK